jgi:hypothetical protein
MASIQKYIKSTILEHGIPITPIGIKRDLLTMEPIVSIIKYPQLLDSDFET